VLLLLNVLGCGLMTIMTVKSLTLLDQSWADALIWKKKHSNLMAMLQGTSVVKPFDIGHSTAFSIAQSATVLQGLCP